jgi:hypothetical protein
VYEKRDSVIRIYIISHVQFLGCVFQLVMKYYFLYCNGYCQLSWNRESSRLTLLMLVDGRTDVTNLKLVSIFVKVHVILCRCFPPYTATGEFLRDHHVVSRKSCKAKRIRWSLSKACPFKVYQRVWFSGRKRSPVSHNAKECIEVTRLEENFILSLLLEGNGTICPFVT